MAPQYLFKNAPRPVKTYHVNSYPRLSTPPATLDLKGKTLLITGGSTGIGLATSKAFASAGISRIVLIARSANTLDVAKQELQAIANDLEVVTYAASVTDTLRITEIVQQVGIIDILILNAGTSHKPCSMADTSNAEFEDTFRVNVFAPFAMTNAAINSAVRAKELTIIYISSAAAHTCVPAIAAYGPSKAAFSQLISAYAAEYRDQGVRAFSMHPGTFATTLAKSTVDPSVFIEEDYNLPAHFAVWLCDHEADFLTGRFVWPHWDLEELLELKAKVAQDPSLLTIGLLGLEVPDGAETQAMEQAFFLENGIMKSK